MTMKLCVPGANLVEIARGLVAALRVFEAAGISPWAAAQGDFRRERWDISGFDDEFEPDRSEIEAADTMDDARQAAIAACCAGRMPIPQTWYLEVFEHLETAGATPGTR